ncbi:MAG: tetratricopeptide repeat protein [Alphaproteobacteria bacterium]|nr:tetratricopeptide repeat protein [Alphaproteobacteria bacterium]
MIRLLAALLLLLLPLAARADAQDAFDRGVASTRAGEHDAAVTAFARAIAEGAVDPDAYHGLGNALWRQGHPGHAMAAWARGLQLDPDDADLAANLALARKQTADRLEPPQPETGALFWIDLFAPRSQVFAASGLCTLGLGLWLLTALRARRAGAPSLRPGVLPPVLVVAGLAAAVGAVVALGRPPVTVVLADQVAARSALGAEGVELFVLHEGAVVRTLERHGTEGEAGAAVLIQLPDARKGWVPADAVDVADPAAPFPLPDASSAPAPG